MRARKLGRKYELRYETSVSIFSSFQSFYRAVRRRVRRKPYLIQKGIQTLLYQGRSFDFRIMVLKNKKRKWRVSGIVGRVALPKKIVTNRSQGGRILPARLLLRPYMSKRKTTSYLRSLFK